jgi:hypothetical protein
MKRIKILGGSHLGRPRYRPAGQDRRPFGTVPPARFTQKRRFSSRASGGNFSAGRGRSPVKPKATGKRGNRPQHSAHRALYPRNRSKLSALRTISTRQRGIIATPSRSCSPASAALSSSAAHRSCFPGCRTWRRPRESGTTALRCRPDTSTRRSARHGGRHHLGTMRRWFEANHDLHGYANSSGAESNAMRSPNAEREPVPGTSDAERPLPYARRKIARCSEG